MRCLTGAALAPYLQCSVWLLLRALTEKQECKLPLASAEASSPQGKILFFLHIS